jgi:carbon-monoxide dehydrogenase large subunit
MFGNQDATDAAFAKAKHVVKLRVENNRLSPVTMEPRVAIGDYNAADDQYTLYATSQNPHGARMEMSHIFHVAENQIRVVSPDVGGGFGLKAVFPDDALVLWAARRIRRPVKWVSTRSESMLTDHHGREMIYYGELALDEHGKILALRAKCLPISSARRSLPAPSRCASFRRPTTSRPCTSCRRGCSPTPRSPVPIAAPDARRRPISRSG